MCHNQVDVISSSNGKPLKLRDHFTYLHSNNSSTESNANICLDKAWTACVKLMSELKSDLSDKIK